jgi:hypothetical protein
VPNIFSPVGETNIGATEIEIILANPISLNVKWKLFSPSVK